MLHGQARLQAANTGQSILAETTARNGGGTIRRRWTQSGRHRRTGQTPAKSRRLIRTVHPNNRVTWRRTTADGSRSHQGDRRPQHTAETTKTSQERSGRQVQETSKRYVLHTRQVRDSGSRMSCNEIDRLDLCLFSLLTFVAKEVENKNSWPRKNWKLITGNLMVWIHCLILVDLLSQFQKKCKCIYGNPAMSSRCPVISHSHKGRRHTQRKNGLL